MHLLSLLLAVVTGLTTTILTPKRDLAQQVKQQNTVFVIQEAIPVPAQGLNLPTGSILRFEGGCLYSASGKEVAIKGQNTCIEASPYHILQNVQLTGTWNVPEAYFEWFGAKGDGHTDDFTAIQRGLDSPLRSFQMLDHFYRIGGYSDAKRRIGLNIPHSVRITGTAQGTFDDYTKIQLTDRASYDIMIQISANGVELNNLTVVGSIGDGGKRVERLIATNDNDAYYDLTLRKVFARHCHSIAFDLATFLTHMERCTAGWCDIGFALHGKDRKVNGTSTELVSCYATHTRKYGYDLEHMSYTTLTSCAADACGFTDTSFDGYPYRLKYCHSLSLNACGCEASYNTISIEGSVGINITGMTDWSPIDKTANAKKYSPNKQIFLRQCACVTFSECMIGTTLLDTRLSDRTCIYTEKCRLCQFRQCITRQNKNGELGPIITTKDCKQVGNSVAVTFE